MRIAKVELGLLWLKAFTAAMHYSAKRGIEIACRRTHCSSVCDVGGSGSHTPYYLRNG